MTIFVYFYLLSCVFLCLVILQKSPQGKAFKERMSERLSGVVGRKDEKKRPLLNNGKSSVAPLDDQAIGA